MPVSLSAEEVWALYVFRISLAGRNSYFDDMAALTGLFGPSAYICAFYGGYNIYPDRRWIVMCGAYCFKTEDDAVLAALMLG